MIVVSAGSLISSIYFVSPLKTGVEFKPNSIHGRFSWIFIGMVMLQVLVGICSGVFHDVDMKRGSKYDIIHGCLSKVLLFPVAGLVFTGLFGSSAKFSDLQIQSIGLIWGAILIVFTIAAFVLEIKHGRASRYSKGSIFAAVKDVGAKKLFSLNATDRMRLIDAKITQESQASFFIPRDSETKFDKPVERMSNFEKGTLLASQSSVGSFIYHPSWEPLKMPSTPKIAFTKDLHESSSNSSLNVGTVRKPHDLSELICGEAYNIKGEVRGRNQQDLLSRFGQQIVTGRVRSRTTSQNLHQGKGAKRERNWSVNASNMLKDSQS
jgi:hypothetical protein